MPNARVFAQVQGPGDCLVISVSAAGAFSVTRGQHPAPNDGSVIPITCDIAGDGTEFIITRKSDDTHNSAVRKRPSNDVSIVPIVGRAVGNINSININATTGVITAGTRTTTVAALFP